MRSAASDHRADDHRSRRPAYFVALDSYAVLGAGRTVALINRDGRVDWWPLPKIDSPPVLAAILDPSAGGFFELVPNVPYESDRRYLDGTNVLETTWRTSGGTARTTIALALGRNGPLPWRELAIRIEGITGCVPFRLDFQPGNRFGSVQPWIERCDRGIVATIGDQLVALVGADSCQKDGFDRCSGTFSVAEGEKTVMGLIATDDEPLFLPEVELVDDHLDQTIAAWRDWSSGHSAAGRWRESVLRSCLVLKTLIDARSGAISAAATTSLPERIGGSKNYDYRFSWVRDSSFVIDALINLNLHDEVQRAIAWLLRAIRRNGGELAVFYTLGGDVPAAQRELDAPGYRESRPVRSGNSAAGQLQLGVYGDLFDAVWRYVSAGHVVDEANARLLGQLADRCCNEWRREDSGIWELDHCRQYTISKIGCWVALDRAVKLSERGQLLTRHVERWLGERECIREFIVTRCWSERRRAYTFYADSDELDAAVLLAGRTGFDRGERLAATIDAIEAELGAGGCHYRYSGAADEEGAFVACTFWMVEALAYCGRRQEAEELMARALEMANDLGIFSEQFDPTSRISLGNLPQALSHLALINAAQMLRDVPNGHTCDPR